MSTSKNSSPKHRMIADSLRRSIQDGILKPGDPIPSYRSLMETHRVTPGTVRQAILALQSEALVQSVPGVGCIVAEPASTRYMVGIAMGSNPSPEVRDSSARLRQFLLDELRMLHDELDRLGCDIALRFLSGAGQPDPQTLFTWAKRLDGVIMGGTLSLEILQAMIDSGVPIVLLGDPQIAYGRTLANLSTVTADIASIMQMAVGHLVGLGHRRILLCSHRGSGYFDKMASCFLHIVAEYGLKDEALEWYYDLTKPAEAMDVVRWLEGLSSPPTAMIVENGWRASRMVEALNAHGWPVPDRISVLGITASTRPEELAEGTTCVLISVHEQILRAARMIRELIRSEDRVVMKETTPVKYVPGKTCRALEDGR